MSRNRLDQETSPYLLQHRTNPVHWRAWGPLALAEARAEGKPILLSVGYAACHWCHVMAHESFENPATAKLMNDLFIPIKVDREERPDIDTIYQTALSLLGQQGGWPLTMFLTPDGEPFWGGTYFPPQPRFGRPAFRDILTGLAEAYHRDPHKIRTNVTALRDALTERTKHDSGGMVSLDLLDHAANAVLGAVDPAHGGLTGAPKFPQIPLFTLLWRAALRTGNPALSQAVTLTLDHMSNGGIYDHLGGGFARYSTDAEWLVPHFEKMLYDNAQLIELLTLVWQETRQSSYRDRVAETVGWLFREMVAEDGAFAATLDADSEGEEGRYYVWTAAEIEEALGEEGLLDDFNAAYGVSARGNWEGNNILNRNHAQPAAGGPFEEDLARARGILLDLRSRRIAPDRDDKILADWNGMIIAALAQVSFAFRQPDWLSAARRAYDAVLRHLGDGDRLGHSYRLGRRMAEAMLDDYAQMARAALFLHEVTGEPSYLEQARRWVDTANTHYWDSAEGGYFFTADDADALILRTKTATDNATPAGNGVMVEVLALLYYHTAEDSYRQRAEDTVAAFSGELAHSFPNMATLLSSWELLQSAVHVVLVGQPGEERREALLRVVTDTSLPNRVLTLLSADAVLPAGHPAAGKTAIAGTATAYVCTGPVCSQPLNEPSALRQALREH